MIIINQNASNTVILTLTEKCTLDNPVFLFVFSNDSTHTEYEFIASDTSEFTGRYNQFTITETSNPDTLAGEVHLPEPGSYHYTVFEQVSSTNLNKNLATSMVEIGKCRVIGTTNSNVSYSPASEVNTVYQND